MPKRLFSAMVSSATFDDEWPNLETKFMAKYLDCDIDSEIQRGQDPWCLDGVADFKEVLNRLACRTENALLEKQAELKLKVASACFQEIKVQIEADQLAVHRWENRKTSRGCKVE